MGLLRDYTNLRMELFEALIASHDNCPQQRRRRISTELQNTRCPRRRRTVCTLTGQDRGKLRWVLASGHQAVTGPYLIWALNSAPASLYTGGYIPCIISIHEYQCTITK